MRDTRMGQMTHFVLAPAPKTMYTIAGKVISFRCVFDCPQTSEDKSVGYSTVRYKDGGNGHEEAHLARDRCPPLTCNTACAAHHKRIYRRDSPTDVPRIAARDPGIQPDLAHVWSIWRAFTVRAFDRRTTRARRNGAAPGA